MDAMRGHGSWAALSGTSAGQTEVFQRVVLADPTTPSQHAAFTTGGALYTSAATVTMPGLATIPLAQVVATSSILAPSAGFRTFIYAMAIFPEPILVSASTVRGWWQLQSSGVSGSTDITGFHFIGKTGVGTDTPSHDLTLYAHPPAYLAIGAANSAVAFIPSAVSAGAYSYGGFISYWRDV